MALATRAIEQGAMLGDTKVPELGAFFDGKGPEYEGAKILNMESGSGLAAAVNEMLLRSVNGTLDLTPTIRVFPAVANDWADVRFSRLRSQGAFLVTLEMRRGRICYVLLESEAGVECRLADLWPGELVVVRRIDGESVPHTTESGNIIFQTEAGKAYAVHPEDADPSTLDLVYLAGDGDQGYRLGIGGSLRRQLTP